VIEKIHRLDNVIAMDGVARILADHEGGQETRARSDRVPDLLLLVDVLADGLDVALEGQFHEIGSFERGGEREKGEMGRKYLSSPPWVSPKATAGEARQIT
jgi:hypothetical protein